MSWSNEYIWSYGYFSVCLFCVATTQLRGTLRQKLVASLLTIRFMANMYYVIVSSMLSEPGEHNFFIEVIGTIPAELYFGIGDLIAASMMFLTMGRSKWQKAVASWFLLMMAAHIAYWIHEPQTFEIQYAYWVSLTAFAWLQLLTVGLWLYERSILNVCSALLGMVARKKTQ